MSSICAAYGLRYKVRAPSYRLQLKHKYLCLAVYQRSLLQLSSYHTWYLHIAGTCPVTSALPQTLPTMTSLVNSLVPLQLALYFHRYYAYLVALITVIAFIYKGMRVARVNISGHACISRNIAL